MLKTVCVTVLFFAVIGQSTQECSDGTRKLLVNNEALVCPDAIDAAPGLCVDAYIRDLCCSSCRKKKSSDPTCPYGDVPEATVRPTYGGKETKKPCPEAIEAGLPCHLNKRICCATCKTLETGDADCPYGDLVGPHFRVRGLGGGKEMYTCTELVAMSPGMCGQQSVQQGCCATCKNYPAGKRDVEEFEEADVLGITKVTPVDWIMPEVHIVE